MNVFAERRKQLLERLQGVLVIPAAQVAIRNNDVEHEYRQDSDFYYLTGFSEPEAVLVLAPNHAEHKFVLFVRKRDPEREAYDGARAGIDGAKEDFGADAAYLVSELDDKLYEYLKGNARLYYRLGDNRAMDDRVLGGVRFTRQRGARNNHLWPTEIVDPATVLHETRIIKREDELDRMRRAAAITRDAHLGAMALARPGRYEYEIEARIREIFRRSGAERIAYEPIIGSGPNATVLHYRQNNRQMHEGELLLIDAGCEYDYYAADVTRTFPVSGTFSPAQWRLYEVVLEAQVTAIEAVKPGANLDAIHDEVVETLVRGLVREGLLEGEPEKIIEDRSYKRFYMHRTSHWLGMDVHDVGVYYQGGAPRSLEPGMVLTIEPGIYISPSDDKVPAEYRGLGIRIEDDILVTPEGYTNLTADIPKSVADVERACRG
ncbi:aminopeptidase P N-terminal domain-containing protein [Polyangium aurulentum]|uniref:aminopeptidase P N-terminal domain-containing protein n=1 Tax=Polyangium aurulentum TaxID=2567896 RepID=UPI0010AEBBD4|nr:aminopeptidase P N-terminal domain-containing protein [Polyangium aurulentum]UQA56617.1 aminopeptidase P N-terminal domain-containing protein [Polyangium aurulentum]